MVLNEGDGGPDAKQDNATDEKSELTLSKAIDAALGGSEEAASPKDQGGDVEAKTSADPKDDAGEKAPQSKAKPQATDDKAVQQDDAKSAEAPQHWPADRRAAFAALPQEARGIVQGFVKDLQGGYTRKMQEVGDDVRFSKSIRGLFTDEHRQQMQRDNVDEGRAIANLIQIHDFASKQPVEYVKWAMNRLGVTPKHLGLNATADPSGKEQQKAPDPLADLLTDPKVKQLEQQLAELANWKAQREAQEREYVTGQTRAREQAYANVITGFRTAQDDSGNLKYPHFDRVGRAMGALMESHPKLASMPDGPDKLELAYEMAVHADPELRAPVIDSEVSRRMAESQRKAEAERAKRAGGIKPASGAPAQRKSVSTLDDALNQSLSQHGF